MTQVAGANFFAALDAAHMPIHEVCVDNKCMYLVKIVILYGCSVGNYGENLTYFLSFYYLHLCANAIKEAARSLSTASV